MSELKFLRIDSLVIGNYLAPNSILHNRLYCRAYEIDNRLAETLKSKAAGQANRITSIEPTLRLFRNANTVARKCLNQMRLHSCGINQKEIGNMIAAHPDVERYSALRDDIMQQAAELALSKQFKTKQNDRLARIHDFKIKVKHHIHHLEEKTRSSVDYATAHSQVIDRFDQLVDGLRAYVPELRERSKLQVANVEFAEMEAMYRRMRRYADNTQLHIDQCDTAINHLRDLEVRIFGGSRLESINKMKEKIDLVFLNMNKAIDAIKVESSKIENRAMAMNDATLTA